MQKGGGSKDTWVLSDGPVSTFSLLPGDGPAGRALARRRRPAEPGRRQPLLAGPLRRARRGDGASAPRHSESCNRAIAARPRSPRSRHSYGRSATRPGRSRDLAVSAMRRAALGAGTGDFRDSSAIPRPTGSLAASIHTLLRIARKVRDRLSPDMWRDPQQPRAARARFARSTGLQPVRAGPLADSGSSSPEHSMRSSTEP